jgi:hypothetical protein
MVLVAAACAALAGCGRRDAQQAGVDTTRTGGARDSAVAADGGYAPDMILQARAGARSDPALVAQVRGALGGWAAIWRRHDPAFRLDSLRWRGPDSCRIEFTVPLSEAWFDTPEQRRHGWALSPDGTRALVTNAYRDWDPDRRTWGYEPDALTVLVDVLNGRWSRVMACGTPCRYDAGAWLDDARFVIAGSLRDGMPERIAPQVWLFDVRRGLQWTATGPMVAPSDRPYDEALDSLSARGFAGPA